MAIYRRVDKYDGLLVGDFSIAIRKKENSVPRAVALSILIRDGTCRFEQHSIRLFRLDVAHIDIHVVGIGIRQDYQRGRLLACRILAQ